MSMQSSSTNEKTATPSFFSSLATSMINFVCDKIGSFRQNTHPALQLMLLLSVPALVFKIIYRRDKPLLSCNKGEDDE